MKMEHPDCSETLAYKIQTPGSYPEESIQQVQEVSIFLDFWTWSVRLLGLFYLKMRAVRTFSFWKCSPNETASHLRRF